MTLKSRIDLWKLKRAMGPSTAFKKALRKDLNILWDAKYSGKTPWYQMMMTRAASGFAVVTLLLTGGGGAYAYTSPKVTEGSALYSVKQVIETVEEVTKITPEAKARFYIKKIERREAEREVLEKKIKLPEVKKVEPKEKEEVKDEKKDIKQAIKEEIKEVKVEVKGGVSNTGTRRDSMEFKKEKIEAEERRIKRTEKSIEKIEEQLEKTRQIIEKNESKNIKLRRELKDRAEKRMERAKKQLEIKAEIQKNNQEKIEEFRQRGSIKTEVRNTSSLTR